MQSNRYHFSRANLAVLISILTTFAPLSAQEKTLDRDLEPVVLAGNQFQLYENFPLDELFLYAFQASTQEWQQIPFQFDERNGSGDYFGTDDGLLDANDELVFMAADAGDLAPTSWIPNVESRIYVRYCVEVEDPLTQNKGWVYLYRSETISLDDDLVDYVERFQSETGNDGEDRVETPFYELAHGENGLPKDLVIKSLTTFKLSSGSGLDLLTAMEFLAKADLPFPFGSITIDEDNIQLRSSESDSVRAKDGLVRLIRELEATLEVPVISDPSFSTPPAFYYAHSLSFDIEIPDLPVSVVEARMSLNFTQAQLNFINASNPEPGFPMDGVPESPVNTFDNTLNWMSAVGSQDAVVAMFPFDPSPLLFYEDNNGDGSFGNSGILFEDGIDTPTTLRFKGFFLTNSTSAKYFTNGSLDAGIGAQIAEQEATPLQASTFFQDFGAVPVELVSFGANVEQNDVRLSWVTATETNNFGFDVERKRIDSGTLVWEKIAFVPGHGTRSSPKKYEYLDAGLHAGTYEYRLKQIDTDGSFEYFDVIQATVGLPETFVLMQNFPNPFNPSTEIRYQLPAVSTNGPRGIRTTLKIYNMLGQEIATLVDREEEPGFYSVVWDGRGRSGQKIPSGMYVYRLQSGAYSDTKKMILVQ